jgi:hypothetical protein
MRSRLRCSSQRYVPRATRQADTYCAFKISKAAFALFFRLGAIDLNRPDGSVNRPYQRFRAYQL